MSQVMPDTGVGVTEGEGLPEPYHHAASTRPAHNTDPRMRKTARGEFFAGICFAIKVVFSRQVKYVSIDFGNSMAIWSCRVHTSPGSGRIMFEHAVTTKGLKSPS